MITPVSTYGSQSFQGLSPSYGNYGESFRTGAPTDDNAQGQQQDTVSLSEQGRDLSKNAVTKANGKESDSAVNQSSEDLKTKKQTAQDLAVIEQLKKRDADVRTHEQAHLSVAGRYATGGATFSYQTGPDGVKYAVGGEVPIDLSPESTPEATVQKMETIKRAALAPIDPSAADRQIAAEASAQEVQAMLEAETLQRAKVNPQSPSANTGTAGNRGHEGEQNNESQSSSGNFSSPSPGQTSGNAFQLVIKAYQGIASLA